MLQKHVKGEDDEEIKRKEKSQHTKTRGRLLDGCKFFIDTNGLLPIDAFKAIFTKIDPAVIARLNEVLNGV